MQQKTTKNGPKSSNIWSKIDGILMKFVEKRGCLIQSVALFAQPGTPSKPSLLLGKTMVFEEFVFFH